MMRALLTSSRSTHCSAHLACLCCVAVGAELLRRGQEGRLQQLAQPRTQLWQRCAEIKVLEEQEQLQVGVAQAQRRDRQGSRLTSGG